MPPDLLTTPGDTLFAVGPAERRVAVIIPLHNYQQHIIEALTSVAAQLYRDVILIVIDDASTDQSRATTKAWMEQQTTDISLCLIANHANAGLAITRNTGIAAATASELCFFLDADNALYPRCLAQHVAALDAHPEAAGAHALIEVFGRARSIIGANAFSQARLAHGNMIDAMAMLRRTVLIAHNGFAPIPYGWEDYDLWLRLCEADQTLIQIPEILARYRNHAGSMLRAITNRIDNIDKLHAIMRQRHPWIKVGAPSG